MKIRVPNPTEKAFGGKKQPLVRGTQWFIVNPIVVKTVREQKVSSEHRGQKKGSFLERKSRWGVCFP